MRVFSWVVGLFGIVVLIGVVDLLLLEDSIPGEETSHTKGLVAPVEEHGLRQHAPENRSAAPSAVPRQRDDFHAALPEPLPSPRASVVNNRAEFSTQVAAPLTGSVEMPSPTQTGPRRRLADDYRCQPLPSPHEDRCGPWFINIGVYKAATRQVLIDLDRCHPEVVRPEPPEQARGWFWEPSMWGTQLQERDFKRYLPLIGDVRPGDFKVTGEKSPDYFFLKQSSIK